MSRLSRARQVLRHGEDCQGLVSNNDKPIGPAEERVFNDARQ